MEEIKRQLDEIAVALNDELGIIKALIAKNDQISADICEAKKIITT